MDPKQQLALRPISTRRAGTGSVVTVEMAAAKERSSLATASFRVYYSLRPGAVPFLWESKPGTPKSAGAMAAAAVSPSPAEMTMAPQHDQLPPISPPPSYHSSQLQKGRRWRCRPRASCHQCQAVAGLVTALLAALGIRRRSHRSAPTSLACLS